jgi:ubiquinone/menaquinone biosynthesis C-methylase UbiE
MAEPYSSRLRIWDGGMAEQAHEPALPRPRDEGSSSAVPTDAAQRFFLQEALLSHFRRHRELSEPYSLPWFLEAEGLRYGRHGRWLPRFLEFGKHGGDAVLGLGPGLGTDWIQYARHGAEVIACGPSAEQLGLAQRNFQLRGLRARFVHASPISLPLDTASIDVACVTSLLRETAPPQAVIAEVYRVLKPGGKVLAIAPAAHDVDFWCRRWLSWGQERQSMRSEVFAVAASLTSRGLRRLFERFEEPRVQRRQLRRQDLPSLLRWFPMALLERVMGRFLVLKAFKPVSAAIPMPAAA